MDRGKRMALVYITLKAAHMPITQKELEQLVGHWGVALLCRRPAYSILSSVFPNQRSQPYPPEDASLGCSLGAGNACFVGALGGIKFAGPAS